MITWRRVSDGYGSGYESSCGRFKVRKTFSSRHRNDGYLWVVFDLHEETSVMTKTARDAKDQASEWGRRFSRKQMKEMREKAAHAVGLDA